MQEMKKQRRELALTCPNCGQVLIRPADFSAERLMYLHQKWGPCFPVGSRADSSSAEVATQAAAS
jgi:hypothetical protein